MSLTQFPSDTTLVFKEMILLNEEAKPKITDYRAWNDEGDFTQVTFEGNKLIIIIKNLNDLNLAAFPQIKSLIKEVKSKNIETIILTSASGTDIEQFKASQQLSVPHYYADATVLKTISRSNPGILLLEKGVVRGKWHFNDTPTPENVLNKLSTP